MFFVWKGGGERFPICFCRFYYTIIIYKYACRGGVGLREKQSVIIIIIYYVHDHNIPNIYVLKVKIVYFSSPE